MNRTSAELRPGAGDSTEQQSRAISQLTQLLRNNGDKVLSGETKLALTTGILNYINCGFVQVGDDTVDNAFDVQQTNNTKQSPSEDLQCVRDFIQKTVGVKVAHGNTTLQGSVNLSKFRALKVLELCKVPIHMVTGLHSLRTKLKTVICTRCVSRLQDLFAACGGDMVQPFPWSELTVAVLSYNNIEVLDSSIELLHKLEMLDLSHNSIRSLRHIECLTALHYLNASYNKLEILPIFHLQTQLHLRCLALRNNNLESLNGLDLLTSLEELDVGYNCIDQHSLLLPMKKLCSLTTVYLDGNPLSYHRKHRMLTILQLHPHAVTLKFQLDGKKLSRSELNMMKEHTAYKDAFNHNLNKVNNINTHPEDLTSRLRGSHRRQGSTGSSSRSSDITDDLTASISSTGSFSKRRRHRAREVEISDEIDANGDGDGVASDKHKHLETKEQIESNRKQFGSSWLVVNTRLTSPKPAAVMNSNQPIPLSSTPPNIEPVLNAGLDVKATSLESDQNVSDESHEQKNTIPLPPIPSDDIMVLHREEEGKTLIVEADVHEPSVYSPKLKDDHDLPFDDDDSKTKIFSDDESESASTFIVQLQRNSDFITLFITVDDDYIREKDGFTGRTVECLDLRSLLSIEKQITPPHCVRLSFDYIRKDRRERQYILEDEANCQLLVQLLQPVLEKRILDEMTVGALQCLACSAEFSKEGTKLKLQQSKKPVQGQPSMAATKEYLQEIPVCPNCGSDIIVELDETPLPQSIQQHNVAAAKESRLNISGGNSGHPKTKIPKLPLKHSTPLNKDLPITNDETTVSITESSSKAKNVRNVRQSQSVVMDLQQNRGKVERLVRDELFGRSYEERSPRRSNSVSKMEGGSRSLSVSPINQDSIMDTPTELLPFAERISTLQVSESSEFVTAECDSREASLSRNGTPPKVHLRESDSHSDNSEDAESPKCRHTQDSTISLKRSDSDITILSNPSQSSISVLSTPSGELGSMLEPVAESHRKTSAPLPPSSSYLNLTSNPPRERSQSLVEDSIQAALEPEAPSESKVTSMTAHDSSSSGSVASSVCTTYERSIYDDPNHRSPGSHSSNGFSAGGVSSECILDTVPTSDSSDYITANSTHLPDCTSDQDTTQPKQVRSEPMLLQSEDSEVPAFKSISSSSIALKDEVTVMSSAKLMGDGFRQAIRYSYDNFTQVDHRIRLHVDVNVFEAGEEFRSILKTNVIKYGKPGEFGGLLIISSKNVYIFKIIGEEGIEPKKWLQKVDVRPVPTLKSLCVHFGKQAFNLEFTTQSNSVSYFFLVRDAVRCSKYITYISGWIAQEMPLNGNATPKIEYNDVLYNNFLSTIISSESLLPAQESVLLYVMGYFWTSNKDGLSLLEPVSFVASSLNVHIVSENLQWCLSQQSTATQQSNTPFLLLHRQAIYNLNEVKMCANAPTEAKFCFADEDTGKESEWHVTMETEYSLHALLGAIKAPWEALYCIDFRVTIVSSL